MWPLPPAVARPYRVTFQIVLFQNGDVGFNYLEAPTVEGQSLHDAHPNATVGVQARGRTFPQSSGMYHRQRRRGTVSCLRPASRS